MIIQIRIRIISRKLGIARFPIIRMGRCSPRTTRKSSTRKETTPLQQVITFNPTFLPSSKNNEFSARDYTIDRSQIKLGDILGEGQFGDVHKGTFRARDGNLIPVAVKTCKGDADLPTTEKFLEEACK